MSMTISRDTAILNVLEIPDSVWPVGNGMGLPIFVHSKGGTLEPKLLCSVSNFLLGPRGVKIGKWHDTFHLPWWR